MIRPDPATLVWYAPWALVQLFLLSLIDVETLRLLSGRPDFTLLRSFHLGMVAKLVFAF